MTHTGYRILFNIGVGDQLTPKHFMFEVWVPNVSTQEEAQAILTEANKLTYQNTNLPKPTDIFRGYGKETISCESAQKAIDLAEKMNAICADKLFEANLSHVRFTHNKHATFNLAVYAMSYVAHSVPGLTWTPAQSFCLYYGLGPGLLDI